MIWQTTNHGLLSSPLVELVVKDPSAYHLALNQILISSGFVVNTTLCLHILAEIFMVSDQRHTFHYHEKTSSLCISVCLSGMYSIGLLPCHLNSGSAVCALSPLS